MTSFLLHILKAVWRTRISGFWTIWSLITGVATIGVTWLVGRAATPIANKDKDAANPRARRYGLPGGAVASVALVILILAAYIVLSVRWEDFADYDDGLFTLFSLRGHNLTPTIWRENGRFFPFGHLEFNLIAQFTGSVFGYHVLPLAQLVLVSCILFLLDGELSITTRGALAALFLILPSTVIIFTG